MKIYYVIDPKGEYRSHKGDKFFKRLVGAELFAFLQTPQAQSKKYYTYREGMDEVYIEVENGRGDRSERHHEAYLYQVKKETEPDISIEQMADGEENGSPLSQILQSGENMEDEMLRKRLCEKLQAAVWRLPDEEYRIIYALFLQPNPISARAYAEMPFGEWLEFWFHTYSKPKLRPTTQLTYWNQIKLHIVPSIGKIALNRLTQKDLQQFYATLKKHGRLKDAETKGSELSNRIVRSCHSLCRMALEKAIEDGLIRKNPAIGCTLPPKQAREMQVLMKEEIERFLIQADEAGCYEFFLLELVTGMRRGELLGLKWSDLNFRTGELHISRQLTTMGFSTPKTKSSIRSILLPGDMVDLLSKMKQKSVSEWMFPSPVKKDMPRDPSAILNLFHRLLERAGCRQVRFHDLRHTFATLALENGMDIKTLSATIGHVSTETTLNIYAHVTDTMRQQAAVKIDQEIGGVSAPLPPNSRCEPILAEEQQEPAENKKTPCQTEIQTTWRKKRKPGTGCVTMINDHLYEGRYTPNVNGKRIARNVYANTREKCEEKLAALIKEMQKEIAEMRTASSHNLAPTL